MLRFLRWLAAVTVHNAALLLRQRVAVSWPAVSRYGWPAGYGYGWPAKKLPKLVRWQLAIACFVSASG